MRSLGTKSAIVFGIFFLAFSALVTYRTWLVSGEHAQELTRRQAELALEFDLAIRRYVGNEIRPVMESLVEEGEFVPETMSTSFVARSIFEDVRREFPDYVIKFSSDNPRNPANQAGPDELEIIDYFNENPDEKRWSGEVALDGVLYQAHFSARRMKESCLRCHGAPEDAPASMVARYGPVAGFHRPVGEVVALDTVAIPLERVSAALAQDAVSQTFVTLLGTALLFGLTVLTFRFMVSRRLAGITWHFREAAESHGAGHLIPVRDDRQDEIGVLARGFNALVTRIREAHATLEEQVAKRTTELATANEELRKGILEREESARELEAAKDAAEVASRAKSDFLAKMSHEIRTPMNGVVGMTDLALDTELSREQRELLTTVKDSADSLVSVINDILDFSKIEAGKLDLDPIDFSLRDCIGDTMAVLGVRADAKGLELVSDVDAKVPDRLVGDAGRLRQILVNLVGNAIKFTERGEVSVRVGVESREPEWIRLRCEVRDTGVGIPAERQSEIFHAFEQADSTTTRRFGGTGLGLAISAQLAEMMDGGIEVESEPGRGSTFRLVARFGIGDENGDESRVANRPRRQVDLDGVRALVIDDNATNRKVLEGLLGGLGMQPEVADSARSGLARLREAVDEGRPFQLLLLDLCMPEMDGFAVAERIQAEPDLQTATVMMISSAGRRGDARKCKQLGVAAYLTKPVRESTLLDAIVEVLGRTRHGEQSPKLITRHSIRERRKLRILLAEDNPVNQKVATRILERRGHSVVVVEDGRAAVQRVEAESFDVVLMDVQMPEMDGLEATAAIREYERRQGDGRHVPIVALTAYAMKGDAKRCLDAGMDAYLPKPLRSADLFAILDEVTAVPPESA